MLYFAAAFAFLVHLGWWGMGASWLVTPRRHWHFWPLFCAPAGMALQSLVVWLAATHTELAGTNVYSHASELVPAALAVWGFWRARRRGLRFRQAVWRTRGVWALMIAAQAVLVAPFTWAAKNLTSMSLGSCDAADYAAGARVFMEFSRSDRGGFMGLTEVVGLHSVDNFFDFWLRLNHFTPSALMALNASVWGWQAYQVVSVLTTTLLVASVPAVMWIARGVLRHSERASLWIAALYVFNPITMYAVYHVATAQLIAATAIALLTWAGVMAWRAAPTWRNGLALSGLLFVAYALILGAYNFIVLVCWVPAVAWAGGCALATGEWRRFVRWLLVMLVPLAVADVVFFARGAGLVERLMLFREADIGWPIPGFAPLGWWGVLEGPTLHGVDVEVRWAGSVMGVFALLAFLVATWQRRRATAWAAVALTAPILVGYAYLTWRAQHLGTNASYDAYKLFAVFYPGMLPAFCGWLMFLRSPIWWARAATAMLAVGVTVGVADGARGFLQAAAHPPLKVERRLTEVQKIEAMPAVTSLNMEVPDFWERLWANQFLLRRAQYFHTYTYEGRRNTAMRGEWELNGRIVRVVPPDPTDGELLNERYAILRRASPAYLGVRLGVGWLQRETYARNGVCWHWTSGDAALEVENPQAQGRRVVMRLLARSLVARELEVVVNGETVQTLTAEPKVTWLVTKPFVVPPGATTIAFHSPQPPTCPGGGDPRLLGFMAQQIELLVQREEPTS